jgi:type I restriction enzyme S subunit
LRMTTINGWGKMRLDQIGTVFSGSTPSTIIESFWDGNIVWVTPNDLAKLDTPYLADSERRITEKGLNGCSAQLLPAGSLVISSRAPIGYVAIPIVPFCTNQGCKSLRLKSGFHSEFVYYNMLFNIDELKKYGEGTTFSEISKTALSSVESAYPTNKSEQIKIADILLTVDHAIEQTEALIAKQQRIKTGLMQDLLTRGIDEHGNLRSEETHQFKDSPLGRIPSEWEVKSLGSALHKTGGFLRTGPFGSQLHAHEYVTEGVPVIMPQDIVHGQVQVELVARVTETKAQTMTRYRVQSNDIVFSRRGDLSRAAAMSEREQGWLCGTGCFMLRVPANRMDAQWLAHAYRYELVQRQIEASAVGSTMPSLNNAVMESLLIAFPECEEQREIASRISAVELVIQNRLIQCSKLRSLKTALMQDLLTGKVRVTPLLDNEEVSSE